MVTESFLSLGFLGSSASIFGLGISIYLFFAVRTIKRHFLNIVRLPELLKDLSGYASEISEAYKNFPSNKKQVIVILSKSESIIDSAKKKLKGPEKKRANALLKEIRVFKKEGTPDKLWDVYSHMQGLLVAIANIDKDNKWS